MAQSLGRGRTDPALLQESTDLSCKADKRALKDAQAALTRAQSDADKAASALTQVHARHVGSS